jgi:hypothetical protein
VANASAPAAAVVTFFMDVELVVTETRALHRDKLSDRPGGCRGGE